MYIGIHQIQIEEHLGETSSEILAISVQHSLGIFGGSIIPPSIPDCRIRGNYQLTDPPSTSLRAQTTVFLSLAILC
jgi:hypothetical protein